MERYDGLPPLPDRINRLQELALDLWWSWNNSARQVFRSLDYPLWRVTAHNPVRMLRMVPQATFELAAADPDFLALYDKAVSDLDAARSAADTW
jgi:glycogen phosphorylase